MDSTLLKAIICYAYFLISGVVAYQEGKNFSLLPLWVDFAAPPTPFFWFCVWFIPIWVHRLRDTFLRVC